MAPTAAAINELLDTLDEEDCKTVIRFIEFLSDERKKKRSERSKMVLREIQEMFSEDKGWTSESAMIEDMAAFRKERETQ